MEERDPQAIAPETSISWEVHHGAGNKQGTQGASISAVKFGSKTVWLDEHASGASPFKSYLRDNTRPGSVGKIEFLRNSTTSYFDSGNAVKELIHGDNDTDTVTFRTTMMLSHGIPVVQITDTLSRSQAPNTLSISTNITAVGSVAEEPVDVTFRTFLSGLQLGRRNSSGMVQLPATGLWRFDSKRMGSLYLGNHSCGWSVADVGTGAYPTLGSYFSPAAAIGDDGSSSTPSGGLSLGFQIMDPMLSPDHGGNFSFNVRTTASDPASPRIVGQHAVRLAPGETHTFQSAIVMSDSLDVGVNSDGSICDSHDIVHPGGTYTPAGPPNAEQEKGRRSIVDALLQPYVSWFHTTWGKDPVYCPSTAVMWANVIDRSFNHTSGWFNPGTTLSTVLDLNNTIEAAPRYGFNQYGVWSSAIQSRHITTDGSSHEFNPTITQVAPNLDAGCDREALTSTLADFKGKAGVDFFWFHRPCSDIVVQGTNESAGYTCDQPKAGSPFKLRKGEFVDGSLSDLASDYVRRQLSKADYMRQHGVKGFYMDSFFCPGGIQYIKELYRRAARDEVLRSLRVAGLQAMVRLDDATGTVVLTGEAAALAPRLQGPGAPLWLMPEGSIDSRSLFAMDLPWVDIGSFIPRLSDDWGLLAKYMLPNTGHFNGQIGGGVPPSNQTFQYFKRGIMGIYHVPVNPPASGPDDNCINARASYQSYKARMEAYGNAAGCPALRPPACSP